MKGYQRLIYFISTCTSLYARGSIYFLVLILATKWNKIELINYAKLKINKTYILLYNFSTTFLHNMYCIGKGLDTAHTAGMNDQLSAELITS